MSLETIVSVADLNNHLDHPKWVVMDCRFSLADPDEGRRMYEASHIPGARFADLNEDLSSPIGPHTGRHPLPASTSFMNCVGRWGIDRSKQVVAYDHVGGAFAARLWWLLRWVAHPSVAVLDGGFNAWTEYGLPTSGDPTMVEQCEYDGTAKDDTWLSAKSLQDSMASDSVLLIDARESERFRGVREPIDPVAGHIPGAINLPFKENLNDDGSFRSAERLRERFEEELKGRAASEVVHMCGSGVTGCHNLLAMEIAGLKGAKLYAGSWSEWIRESSRPVATK